MRTFYDLPGGAGTIPEGEAFSFQGVNYPSNWLQLASDDDLASMGVTKRQEPVDLAALKATLRARVSTDAENCRLRFITPGSGKAMTYLEKHNQAEAVEDLGEAAANALTEQQRKEQFPTLAASVGIEAPTLWECAAIVRARYEAWADISHEIERAELLGKKNISDASDAAAAQAAYEAITWPTP